MASGLPVICLDTGGPGFHIQDEWGIKIKPKSPEYVVSEMAKALEGLYLDRDLRERLGRAARKRAEEFYLWDRLGERLMKIYEEALRNDRPSGR
jgi:glycosyltransferase involved in cell wall biosynthesis